MNARVLLATAALLAAPALACRPDGPPGPGASEPPAPGSAASELAAEVDGVPITIAELDAFIKEQLFERETRGGSPGRLHNLRENALDGMIQTRVLEAAADEAGVTPEVLIEQRVTELGPVTDDEIATFYEENKEQMGEATLADIGDRIRSYLQSQRRDQAVVGLLDEADVAIHLEAPRFEVAAVGPARGSENARVTIVEFSDFQCPYCQRSTPIVEELLERYPEDLRVVYRHLPLERIHPRAMAAAEASMCADDQGRFWEYHDVLFENQRKLQDDDLVRYAGELGLDEEAFQQCLESGRHAEKIQADMAAAASAGITGTPAFLVNGRLVTGAQPVEHFVEIIEEEIAANAPSPAPPGA